MLLKPHNTICYYAQQSMHTHCYLYKSSNTTHTYSYIFSHTTHYILLKCLTHNILHTTTGLHTLHTSSTPSTSHTARCRLLQWFTNHTQYILLKGFTHSTLHNAINASTTREKKKNMPPSTVLHTEDTRAHRAVPSRWSSPQEGMVLYGIDISAVLYIYEHSKYYWSGY